LCQTSKKPFLAPPPPHLAVLIPFVNIIKGKALL
jgi:hypothetical protein